MAGNANTPQDMFNFLRKYFPDVPKDELSAIADEAIANKPAPDGYVPPDQRGGATAETDTGTGETETEADVPDTPVRAAGALKEAETVEEYERLLPIYMNLTGRDEEDVRESFPPPAN